jgi:hypothetical protein
MAHLYDMSGIATCTGLSCQPLTVTFSNRLPWFDTVLCLLGLGIMFAVPAVVGVFWGAPLITREIEARTLPLAWNQSVTKTRWLAVKLALIGLASMATAGLLSLMLTWWSSPMDGTLEIPYGHRLNFERLGPVLFDTRGITPIGYAAFALGITAGLLIAVPCRRWPSPWVFSPPSSSPGRSGSGRTSSRLSGPSCRSIWPISPGYPSTTAS